MGAATSRLTASASDGAWSIGRSVYRLFWDPVAHLEGMMDGNVQGLQREEVLGAAKTCFLAGSFATVVPALLRADQTTVVMEVLCHALNGDLCPLAEAKRLLATPCARSGSNILHVLQRTLIPERDSYPDLFVELLDFLQGSEETLDGLMTMNDSGHHPLYLAMRCKAKINGRRNLRHDESALHIMRRVSPEVLWKRVTAGRGQSTALHAACTACFTAEERLEIIGRIPLEVLAYGRGPHGRTPILQAAAYGADAWVESLLDCLPPEALAVSDHHNCTLVHLMACLPDDSTRERILGLVPGVEHLCNQVASDVRSSKCRGNAAVFHMAKSADSFVPALISLMSDESLFVREARIGRLAQFRCSLLHLAAGRADVSICRALLQRVTVEQRGSLLKKDCFGLTPLHALFQARTLQNMNPADVYGRPKLSICLSSIVDVAALFLEILTDDELQIEDDDGNSVLVQLLIMLTRVKGTHVDTGVFDICQELVDRTSKQCWPGSDVLLRHVFKISQRSLRHCDGRLGLIASILERATFEVFYQDSDLYVDMLICNPNVEAARLVLEATAREAFLHPGNQIWNVCQRLCDEAVGRPTLGKMLRLLIEYIPPAALVSAVSYRFPAPLVTAINSGNVDAVAAMLAVCPEARTAEFDVEGGTVTALELALRRNEPQIASLLQPLAKSAATHR